MPAEAAQPLNGELAADERASLAQEARLIVDLLQNQHYLGRPLSGIAVPELLDDFVRDLDPEALLFTRDDVDFVHRRFDRSLKSVYLFRGDLQPAFEIFDLMLERLQVRGTWIDERLGHPFDLAVDEPAPDGQKPAFMSDARELDVRWTRRLREHVIVDMLAGADETTARASVAGRYLEWRQEFARTDALTVRERFLNILLAAFDPHSGYFSADAAQAFDEMMGAATFTLGLGLHRRQGRWEVAYLFPGAPAELSGVIERGDVLEALAEGDGPWQELAKVRFREIARLLRGAEGSRCRVAVRAAGNDERHDVELTRQRLVLGGQRARGAVWTMEAGAAPVRVGWIHLPAFYGAPEARAGAASATRDVHELLGRMQQTGIGGLVLDLRQNGGGAIPEAVALAGLFLDTGVVAQARGLDGVVRRHEVVGSAAPYPGPLVVLVSENSASASELLAGTLRQHGRAVVAGPARTFGKGTLQDYIDLADLDVTTREAHGNWGVLRLTSQLFFLPDGNAVQRHGIPADITLPSSSMEQVKREADLPRALPAETIAPAVAAAARPAGRGPVTAALLTYLRERSSQRASTLPEFALAENERVFFARHRREAVWGRSLAFRRDQQAAMERERAALRRERRTLTAAGFATAVEFIDVADVAAAWTAHQTHVKEAPLRDGRARAGRLHRGSFFPVAADGTVGEVRLESLQFADYLGDAEVLAAAAAASAGAGIAADEVTNLLRALDALARRDDAAVLACARRCLPSCGAEDALARRAVDGILGRLFELEGTMLKPETGPDLPLRESVRIVLDWARAPSEHLADTAASGGPAREIRVNLAGSE